MDCHVKVASARKGNLAKNLAAVCDSMLLLRSVVGEKNVCAALEDCNACNSDEKSFRGTVVPHISQYTDQNVHALPLPPQGARTVLDNSTNNFEKGATDTFLLKKHAQMGELTKLRIGHDNKGFAPGAGRLAAPREPFLLCCLQRLSAVEI